MSRICSQVLFSRATISGGMWFSPEDVAPVREAGRRVAPVCLQPQEIHTVAGGGRDVNMPREEYTGVKGGSAINTL